MLRKSARQKLLTQWIDKLRLGDWKTTLVVCGRRAMTDSNGDLCDGLSTWSTEEGTVTISLRRDLPDEAVEPTLIHELLHVRLEGHRNHDGSYDQMYERALNVLVENLLEKNERTTSNNRIGNHIPGFGAAIQERDLPGSGGNGEETRRPDSDGAGDL